MHTSPVLSRLPWPARKDSPCCEPLLHVRWHLGGGRGATGGGGGGTGRSVAGQLAGNGKHLAHVYKYMHFMCTNTSTCTSVHILQYKYKYMHFMCTSTCTSCLTSDHSKCLARCPPPPGAGARLPGGTLKATSMPASMAIPVLRPHLAPPLSTSGQALYPPAPGQELPQGARPEGMRPANGSTSLHPPAAWHCGAGRLLRRRRRRTPSEPAGRHCTGSQWGTTWPGAEEPRLALSAVRHAEVAADAIFLPPGARCCNMNCTVHAAWPLLQPATSPSSTWLYRLAVRHPPNACEPGRGVRGPPTAMYSSV